MEKLFLKLYLESLATEAEWLNDEVFRDRVADQIIFQLERLTQNEAYLSLLSDPEQLRPFIYQTIQERTMNLNKKFEYIRPALRTIILTDLENNLILQRHLHILSGNLIYKCIYQKNQMGISDLNITLMNKKNKFLENKNWEFEPEIDHAQLFVMLDIMNDYINKTNDCCLIDEDIANAILERKEGLKEEHIEMMIKEVLKEVVINGGEKNDNNGND